MKKTIGLVFIGLFLVVNGATAELEVTIKEAGIAFSLPDKWEAKPVPQNRTTPTMESYDPLYLGWQREPIADSAGRQVRPGINVLVFNVPADTDTMMVSNSLMHQRGWPFKGFLTGEKDGLKLPRSMGYISEFSPEKDAVLRLFVVHAVNDGKFVEFVFFAIREVFPAVEAEFRGMIQTLCIAK